MFGAGRVDDLLSNPDLSVTQRDVLSQVSQFEQGLMATDFAPDESMGKRGFQLYEQLSETDSAGQAPLSNGGVGSTVADFANSAGSAANTAPVELTQSSNGSVESTATDFANSTGSAVNTAPVKQAQSSYEGVEPFAEVKTTGQLANERLSALEQQQGIANDKEYRYQRISSLLETANLSDTDIELLSNLKQFEYDARLLNVADVAYGEYNESLVASGLAEGQRIISAEEFEHLSGTKLKLDHDSDYQAVLVYDDAIESYILGNRGTESPQDVVTDLIQSAGFLDNQYQTAYENAGILAGHVKSEGVGLAFTGHSLGGGLAATQALATGFRATTFNAAGVHSDTLQRLQVPTVNVERASDLVRANYVDGEILTAVQSSTIADVGSGIVGTLIRTPIEAGKAIAGLFDDDVSANFGFSYVPEAVGTKIELPAVDLNGAPITGPDWLTSSADRHKMDYVYASMGMHGHNLYSQLGN